MVVLLIMHRKMYNNHQNVQASPQEFMGSVSVIIPLVHAHLNYPQSEFDWGMHLNLQIRSHGPVGLLGPQL